MPRAPRSGRDPKTPAYVPSKGDSSSSDEDMISVRGRVAQALQSHFDRDGDDITPKGGIDIGAHTRSRGLVETANVSMQSYTASGVGPSQVTRPEDRRLI